jgi:hypothetical protein
MKGVYILACLVGLGFVTWVAILVVNGVRARNARKLNQKLRREAQLERKDQGHL